MSRNHEFKIKISKDEKEKLEEKAKILGLKAGTYVRMVSLNAKVDIKEK